MIARLCNVKAKLVVQLDNIVCFVIFTSSPADSVPVLLIVLVIHNTIGARSNNFRNLLRRLRKKICLEQMGQDALHPLQRVILRSQSSYTFDLCFAVSVSFSDLVVLVY